MPSDKLYTSTEIGELLQVTASSVVKWVNAGLLVAYTTPGGHRRIRIPDLVVFLRKHGMYIPPELDVSKRKVLFVDDHPALLRELKRAMKPYHEKVELLTAESAVEALVMIGLDRPDVLFLDYSMPDLDGMAVLAQLKSRPETRSIEVVLVTGALTPQLEKKAHALGAKAVVRKPISPADVVELSSIKASA